ncbi:hypothetical protein [Bradyrhizobium sp. CCBAU 51753]|uniref:hypothetical protein n=1 Tax=Bradyrhizobium sp. CCBAU 51753 TaxID=1325100 RepID=UPI00188BEB00|nr:hypothetical protein [Bradyrhizobium sp. CCBAU 51753]QOZ26840.1 hypothetical protein XH93_26935 [Bradyrhizobium sp. CCBAU 51753]
MEILRNRAKTFVVFGWVFFVVSVPVCLLIRAAAGFSSFYFPAHPQVTLNSYDMGASNVVLAAGAFAAVASSIALALKFRATASALVIVIWSTAIAGTQVVRSFVKPGPDYFERHIGPEVFLVPWWYADSSPGRPPHETPNEIGFVFDLCLSNLKGRTDIDCRFIQQVRVLPNEKNVADPVLESWRKYRSQMSPGPDRSGYQSFDLRYALQTAGPTRVEHYFARLNSNGDLTRLVKCWLGGERFCMHRALVGNYWFGYEADLAAADETLDAELAALVESWRRK